MSNIQIRIVLDTNIIFMAWYNPSGKCAQILRKSRENKINLFAPDTVKEEIIRVFRRHGLPDAEIEEFLDDFSIDWIDKEIYKDYLEKTMVKHKPDKPIEAVALVLNYKLLSADRHFDNVKQKIDIDDLLKQVN